MQLPTAMRVVSRATLLVYDETKRLSTGVHAKSLSQRANAFGDSQGQGIIPDACMVALLETTERHGTGHGQVTAQGPTTGNVRGYCQAMVTSAETVCVFVDRVYPRQEW